MTRLRAFSFPLAFAGLTVLSLAGAACTGSSLTPTVGAAFSQTDLRLGAGTIAASGNGLSVHYTGWLYDGTKAELKGLQFETSVGAEPFTFTLGTGQVIKGWEQGVEGMRPGGLRRLVIPPSLAYGATRSGSIPANTTLVFEIELLTVTVP